MSWWADNIFRLKAAWLENGGSWTDQECQIIEARTRELLAQQKPLPLEFQKALMDGIADGSLYERS